MSKKNFYVVWEGRRTGVFNSWNECFEQVYKYNSSKHKGFKTFEEAEKAFKLGYFKFREYQKKSKEDDLSDFF